MSASKDEVGLKPTSTTGANNGANAALQVLGITSNFNACMKENVKDAAHTVKPFLKILTEDNLAPEDDPSKQLETAMKEISPQKANVSLQARFEGALSQVEPREPTSRRGSRASTMVLSTATTPTTANSATGAGTDDHTQSTYKNLKETMNMTSLLGPVIAFLENLLEKQSRLLRAQFATTGDKKHDIYIAIENCQIGEFRRLLKVAFNNVYPKESRIRARILKMTAFDYDSSKHDLLHLREVFMDTIRDIIDITDDKDLSGPHGSMAATQIAEHFATIISTMDPFMIVIINRFIPEETQVMMIEGILLKADSALRKTNPTTYGVYPTEAPVRANVARPERKPISNPCPAC